jgi:hypothetical protein
MPAKSALKSRDRGVSGSSTHTTQATLQLCNALSAGQYYFMFICHLEWTKSVLYWNSYSYYI